MNPYAWGILVSLVVYFVVGNYAGRKVRHLDDYYVAGRRAPTLLVVGTLVASLLSTTAFLGEVGMAYSGHGAIVLMLVAVNVSGYILGAIFFGRHLRRSRARTVAEYFGHRFASRRVQVAAGITVIVGLGAYLVAVTQGVALIVEQVAGIPFAASLALVWFGYTVFTMYAGSRGVIITDTIMFLLFTFAAFLAMAYVVAAGGGWFETVHALATYADKPGIIAWHGTTGPGATWASPAEALGWALILGLAWSVVVAVSPWQASRYLLAKNEQTVLRAACGAAIALLLMYPVLMLCGAAINLGNPGIVPADTAMIWAAQNLMPTFAGVVLMSGIMAAGLSSATTFLSLVGFSASNDVSDQAGRSEVELLRFSRGCMLAVGVAVLVLAYVLPPRIFWITYFVATVFASSWGPVAILSVWSSRITAGAAFWGIISGFVGNCAAKALDYLGIVNLPVWADPIILGAALSTAVILAVSRRGTVSEAEHRYRTALHIVPAAEKGQAEIRATRRWPPVLIGTGVVLTLAMIVFWVLPYHAVTGTASFWSGELFVSLGCGAILVLSGLAIRRHLRND